MSFCWYRAAKTPEEEECELYFKSAENLRCFENVATDKIT